MAVDETVTYMPHPEDSNKTLQRQEAIVTVHGMPLESYMENLMTNKISVNAGKVIYFWHIYLFDYWIFVSIFFLK